MENAGAVTFREVALLADPATAPLAVQKRVAEVITHELAHQWFGNLVTMAWWDDLWLNEAFATWMAYKIVDDWRPSWRIWMDFEAGKGAALALDALVSAHPSAPRSRTPRRRASRSTPSPTRRAARCCACSRGSWARTASATASASTCAATARRTRPPTICGARSARRRGSRSSSWRTAGSGRPATRWSSLALERDAAGTFVDLRQRRFFAEPGAAARRLGHALAGPGGAALPRRRRHQGAARCCSREESARVPLAAEGDGRLVHRQRRGARLLPDRLRRRDARAAPPGGGRAAPGRAGGAGLGPVGAGARGPGADRSASSTWSPACATRTTTSCSTRWSGGCR